MDGSNALASYYIQIMKNNENKGSQMGGHTKKIFIKRRVCENISDTFPCF